MEWIPKFNRVLLEREKIKTSSIIIPETAEKRNAPDRGKVVACGPEVDSSIKVGMNVIFGRHAGDWIKDGERELFIIADEDVLVELKGDTPKLEVV